jgi:two-component system, response regulator
VQPPPGERRAPKLIGDGPVVMVDDNDADVDVALRYYKKSRLTRPFIRLAGGEELLAYLDDCDRSSKPLPSLVMLDINMIGIDGHETLRRVRADPRFVDLPVLIMVSGSRSALDRAESASGGANGFFSKPLNAAEYLPFFNALAPDE